jgi:PIN domain nuclease of toxin-antitoxin system
VTVAVLLDTHIALWLDTGSDKLRRPTLSLIDDCWRGGGTIYLSAVSAWEIALLVDVERISLDLPVDAWVQRFLGRPGIKGAPLDIGAASRAYGLPGLEHSDPADRLLIATSMELGCPLVTYDDRILRFGQKHGRALGFSSRTE